MLSNKTFYPTPSRLASKMIAKIKGDPGKNRFEKETL